MTVRPGQWARPTTNATAYPITYCLIVSAAQGRAHTKCRTSWEHQRTADALWRRPVLQAETCPVCFAALEAEWRDAEAALG